MLSGQSLLVDDGLNSVLVVVNVPLPVDGLDLLDSLVTGDVLLDDGGGGLGADLGRVGLVGSRQAEGVEGRGRGKRTTKVSGVGRDGIGLRRREQRENSQGLDVVDDSAGGRSVVNVGVGRHFDRVRLVWFGRGFGLRDAMKIVLLREEERERDSCSSIRWSIEPDRSIY